MICKITQKQKILTPVEKAELVAKYESGMTMGALASLYGCHDTTVSRLIRKRSNVVRNNNK